MEGVEKAKAPSTPVRDEMLRTPKSVGQGPSMPRMGAAIRQGRKVTGGPLGFHIETGPCPKKLCCLLQLI